MSELAQWVENNKNFAPRRTDGAPSGRNVTVRLTAEDVMHLEGIAARFGKKPTRAAEEMLQAALRDAWVVLTEPYQDEEGALRALVGLED